MPLEKGKTNTSKTPPAFDVHFTREELMKDLLWGIGTSDQHGHSSQIRIRIHPTTIDMANQVLELAPHDWFTPKNRNNHTINAFWNSALKCGMRMFLKLLSDYNVDVKELDKACRDLSVLGETERRLELAQYAAELQKKMAQTKGDPSKKMDRLSETIDRMNESIHNLQTGVEDE